MASYLPTRFGNGTGSTTATATTTVTSAHRFILTGGAASIKVNATGGAVTCVVTTGSAVQTFNYIAAVGVDVSFVVAEGGVLAPGQTGETVVIPIGKHFVALSGETLSMVITGPAASTGANVVMHGVDYTE